MRSFAAALLFVLLASPAWAQDHRWPLTAYVAGATLDYHSTYRAMSAGHREMNPLGRLTEGSPTATVVGGAALDVVVTSLLYKWLHKDHPKLTTVLLYTAAGVRGSLAARNYAVVKR